MAANSLAAQIAPRTDVPLPSARDRSDGDRHEVDAQRVADARRVFRLQAMAVASLSTRLGVEYSRAIELILQTKGHVVTTGMGKSGLVARKIAATFASTGTPAFFIHAGDALHGDLGKVRRDDLMVLVSYSGETEEVLRLVPRLRELGLTSLALVGNLASTLATCADVALEVAVEREVCPNNLAPTTSSLATMAMGDALAVSLMRERNFQARDFERFHPGGALGRRLLTRVSQVMRRHDLPIVGPEQTVSELLLTITAGRLGLALVVNDGKLVGIVTDGDLRRAMEQYEDVLRVPIYEIMNTHPKAISEDAMLVEAEERMEQHDIKALVVVDKTDQVRGVLEAFQR